MNGHYYSRKATMGLRTTATLALWRGQILNWTRVFSFVSDSNGTKKQAAFLRTRFTRHFAGGACRELCGNGALQAVRILLDNQRTSDQLFLPPSFTTVAMHCLPVSPNLLWRSVSDALGMPLLCVDAILSTTHNQGNSWPHNYSYKCVHPLWV
jgi:hypothetical protein